MSSFRPMLASPADLDKLRFPLMASPKLDGIRCSIVDNRALSRTLKPIPNKHICSLLNNTLLLDGLDGELIVGSPTDKDVYRNTTSGVMAHAGEPEFTYWVFDVHDRPSAYFDRLGFVMETIDRIQQVDVLRPRIQLLEQKLIAGPEALLAYEEKQIELGYEGIILRDPKAHYKYGRSTTKEGYLLKVKRFEDSEAEVIGVVEEMHNGNAAEVNELGRTKRSSAKAGKTGKNTMGTLVCRDIKSGVEFEIGTGFTAADRVKLWAEPPIGQLVKYKFFPVGVKDKPRHPVFLGFRDRRDL